MKRFFGMMPSSETEITKTFRDSPDGWRVTLEAGPNGWTLIFADGSAEYGDSSSGTKANYNAAYNRLLSIFPEAIEIDDDKR